MRATGGARVITPGIPRTNYCCQSAWPRPVTFHPLCVWALANSLAAKRAMQKHVISTFEFDRAHQRADPNALLIERRNAIRYVVGLKVAFRWTDPQGLPRQAEGRTRDVSPKGTYVLAASCPPRQAKVQIEFELSPEARGPQALRLEGQGSVLRVEPANGRAEHSGFAVQLRRTRVLTR